MKFRSRSEGLYFGETPKLMLKRTAREARSATMDFEYQYIIFSKFKDKINLNHNTDSARTAQ
jgi:hypothetical protein